MSASSRGQALVELAVVLPVFLILLWGCQEVTAWIRTGLRAQALDRVLAAGTTKVEIPLEVEATFPDASVAVLDRHRSWTAELQEEGALADGADVVPEKPEGAFVEQVRQVLWLGQPPPEPSLDALSWLMPTPKQDDVFLVSKNYRPLDPGEKSGCTQWPGFPQAARHGPMDLGERLDAESERCFDTAPFRDTHAYAQSLYAEMFRARGPYFLGCAIAEAEDPTSPSCGASP